MKKTCIILFCAAAVSTVSCKGYLDVKPQGKVIPQTDEEYEAILNYILNDIEVSTGDIVLGGVENIVELEPMTDNLDANISLDESNPLTLYSGSNINNWQGYYAELYSTIKDCNILIDAMSERTSVLSRDITTTSRAIKAICYYNLLRGFCEPYEPATASERLGLSLVDHFDMENFIGRSNLQASGEYLLEQFRLALQTDISDSRYLFTRDAINFYVARTLFWMQRWDEAAPLCEELLAKYPLASGTLYADMITVQNDVRGEVVIRSYTKGSKSDFYYTTLHKEIRTRPVNKSLVDLFAADGDNDVRRALFYDAKRLNLKPMSASLRSSELSLMLAECYCHMDEPGKALAELNRFRAARITGVTGYTMETLPPVRTGALIRVDAEGAPLTPLLAAIFDERRKEFYMEGDRWYELKRNGRPEWWIISNARKYTTKQYLYTFPIKRTDAEVGGITQNEGYVY